MINKEEICCGNCDKCEHGVAMPDQFYDDGTPIRECGIRPTEQSEQEAKQYALGYQDVFLDAKKMFGGDLNNAIRTIKTICQENNTCNMCPMNWNCNEQPAKWKEAKGGAE